MVPPTQGSTVAGVSSEAFVGLQRSLVLYRKVGQELSRAGASTCGLRNVRCPPPHPTPCPAGYP